MKILKHWWQEDYDEKHQIWECIKLSLWDGENAFDILKKVRRKRPDLHIPELGDEELKELVKNE